MRVFRPLQRTGGAQRRESGPEPVDQEIAFNKHKFQAG